MSLTKQDLKAIDTLLDNKLDEKLEPLKRDLTQVKTVVEREFKRVDENFKTLGGKVETIENQLGAIIGDYEPRLERLEKNKKVSSSN